MRLSPRPAVLAGREALLAEIDARLAPGPGRSGPQVAVLCGLGGAGKTSVAVEYAHRQLGGVGVCWQFTAEDPAVLAAQFAVLAAQLGARDVADARDPVAAVHAVLARAASGWLVVFDNAPDLAAVEAFVPPAGPGRVLVASQSQHWPTAWTVQVPVLDPAVAAQFLTSRTGDADHGAALELASELGGLPLALEQAGAYMQASGESLAGYLSSFRQRRQDMLGRGEPTGYRGTVTTTWALAFTRLEQSAPGAAGLLRLLAFCAPEAVPLRLLLQPRPGLTKELRGKAANVLKPMLKDRLAATDAIAALRRYSLISSATDGSVSVHRLVQAVTTDQMPTELAQSWQQATTAVIEAAIPLDPQQPRTWPVFAALLPHAQTALTTDSFGMDLIVAYLWRSGNSVAACGLARRVLDGRVRGLGPEHPSTVVARQNLAYLTGAAGDAAAARDQFAALLPVVERVFGPEYPNTLSVRDSLADWTGKAGDAAAARHQLAMLLPIEDRVLGPEHPETLSTRSNLARWTGEAGDAAGARDQFAALLPVSELALGAEHPDTLATRDNLAYWTRRAAGDLR